MEVHIRCCVGGDVTFVKVDNSVRALNVNPSSLDAKAEASRKLPSVFGNYLQEGPEGSFREVAERAYMCSLGIWVIWQLMKETVAP